MGTPTLCALAEVGGARQQLLGAGLERRWMRLHGRGGHLWREEGWKAELGGRREQLGTGGEEGSPSPSPCPQAAPPSRMRWADGHCWMDPGVLSPGCANPDLIPVPARSCPFLPAWACRGADPTMLRLPSKVTPGQQ